MALPEIVAGRGKSPELTTGTRRRLRPVAVRVLLGVLLLAALVAGSLLLVASFDQRAAARDYRSAPRCPAAATTGCWTGVRGTVSAREDSRSVAGRRSTAVTVALSDGVTVRVPVVVTPQWTCLAHGDTVEVKSWHGAVTTVFTAHGSLPTRRNPLLTDALDLEAGVALLSVAAVVVVGAGLNRYRRARRAAAEPPQSLLLRMSVRVALGVFLVGQLADLVTSALGDDRGLVEANELVAAAVSAIGPLAFLIVRLPVIGLFLLGLSRVPRRALLVVLWTCGIVFSAVGAHNLDLVVAHSGPPGCPVAALP